MGLLDFILGKRPNTASVAKERLQIVLAHERWRRGEGASRGQRLRLD